MVSLTPAACTYSDANALWANEGMHQSSHKLARKEILTFLAAQGCRLLLVYVVVVIALTSPKNVDAAAIHSKLRAFGAQFPLDSFPPERGESACGR